MKEFFTNSAEETALLAKKFAKQCKKGSVVAFLGGMGMGKTAFTAGFVCGLGIDAEVSSPTFSICNDYRSGSDRVLHYDMYRIENWDDLYSTGFFESLDSGAYILIEWSENVFFALPENSIIIKIESLSENGRKFQFMTKQEAQQL